MSQADPRPNRHMVARQAARLTLAVWGFTFILFLMPQLVATGRMPHFVLGWVLIAVMAGIALSALLYWACARLQDAPTGLKLGGVFAAVCTAALAFSLFDSWLGGEVLRLFMSAHRIRADLVNMTVSNFISFSWLYGLLGTLYVILQTNAAMRERDLQLAEARTLAQTAQLTALRLQLNPHFLFNTLNAISSLIVTGRNRDGEAMLSKLCDFLRTALMSDARATVTLGEELETLQTYLEIETIRFGDRLTVEFVCPEALLDLPIPNFILQPLVENAVKHAVAPTSRPIIVRIAARREGRDLILSVTDNGGGAGAGKDLGTGVGFANTRRRIEVLYGSRARLETMVHDEGFLALIRLPISDEPLLGLVA
jgi:LytS/YehU family sensor histidine kinase